MKQGIDTLKWIISQLEQRELQHRTFKHDRDEITLTLDNVRFLVDTNTDLEAENKRLRDALGFIAKTSQHALNDGNACANDARAFLEIFGQAKKTLDGELPLDTH